MLGHYNKIALKSPGKVKVVEAILVLTVSTFLPHSNPSFKFRLGQHNPLYVCTTYFLYKYTMHIAIPYETNIFCFVWGGGQRCMLCPSLPVNPVIIDLSRGRVEKSGKSPDSYTSSSISSFPPPFSPLFSSLLFKTESTFVPVQFPAICPAVQSSEPWGREATASRQNFRVGTVGWVGPLNCSPKKLRAGDGEYRGLLPWSTERCLPGWTQLHTRGAVESGATRVEKGLL